MFCEISGMNISHNISQSIQMITNFKCIGETLEIQNKLLTLQNLQKRSLDLESNPTPSVRPRGINKLTERRKER